MILKLQLVEFKQQIAIEVIEYNKDFFKGYLDKYFVVKDNQVTIHLALPNDLDYFVRFTRNGDTSFGGRGLTLNMDREVKMVYKDSKSHYNKMTNSIKLIMNHIKTIEKLQTDMMYRRINKLFDPKLQTT